MSDKSNVADFLQRMKNVRAGSGDTDTPSPSSSNASNNVVQLGKKGYKAIDKNITGNRLLRLRVNYSNGDISLLGYGYLQEVISVSPEYIALIFTTGGVTLTGKNLRELLEVFESEDVKAVYPFDPNIHIEPEEGEPKIESITFRRVIDLRED